MRVTELCVYPVKGAAGIPISEARLDTFGIEHDRRWMIVGGDGTFITQRNHAGLALLATALEPDALVLRSRLAGEARVPLRPEGGEPVRVTVWADEVDALDAGDVAAAFLEAHLGFPARLVHMPESTHRQAPLSHARDGDRVSFADAFPLLLITQESLAELDHRLRRPIPMARFRPNVVVAGASAHAEDAWRRIRIGGLECDVVKPCARCVVPTIDPATARPGPEPLRTLAGYRRWEGQVWFGQNVIHRGTGMLRTGDRVTVIETGPARPPIGPPTGLSAGTAAGSPPTV